MNISDRTINALQARKVEYQQPEGAILPYTFNFASLLDSDTIATSTWSTDGTAVLSSPANTTTTATVKVSGSPGYSNIVNTITTAAGVTDQRIIRLHITANDDYTAGDYN